MEPQAPDSPTDLATSKERQLFEDAGPQESSALPKELGNVSKALEKALHDPMQLPGAFSNFCAAAYVKPEWAGVASDYLVDLFADHEDALAEMTRVPDLIIELASGHYTLTFLVASRWAEKADLARLVRLAEALVATQSKMNCPEVVDLMLALTTSLAISRYPRAEQLLVAADGHVTLEQQDALEEARLWLGAGKMVRGCSQEARDLWDYRLRRPRTAWPWTSREECDALNQLSDCLDPTAVGASLFQAVVPVCWWDIMMKRVQDHADFQIEMSLESAKPQAVEPPQAPQTIVKQPIIIWRGIPFFIGGLVGAWALLLGIWISPFDLVRPAPDEGPAVMAASSGSASASGNPESTQAAPALELPQDVWRKEKRAALEAETPELRAWAEKIELGTWTDHQAFLEGNTPELPKEDPKYFKLLSWLHVDPPSNPEIRKQVPLLLANLRQDSTVIDLWEKLVYPGSIIAADIQAAALRTQHDNKDAWSPTQRAFLSRIATLPITPVGP